MSNEFYFRDINKDNFYNSFNQQIKEIQQTCLNSASSLKIVGEFEFLKESFLEEIETCSLFKPKEPDYERFIIGLSTANHFYWRRDNGFDGLQSVQQFMEQNPHMFLSDESGKEISFEFFIKNVGYNQKVQRDYVSGDLVTPSLSDQILSSSGSTAQFRKSDRVLKSEPSSER